MGTRFLVGAALLGALTMGAPSVLAPTVALAESRVGNGGDSMAAEFVSVADETVELLETLRATDSQGFPAGFDFAKFKQSVRTAKVFTQDKTLLGSVEVDALNVPAENRIVVSRARWRGVGYDLKTVRLLVIHEYLGLTRQDDSSYQISTYLVRKINNGGSRGELWPLKDIDDPRYTNPFYGAFFEGTFQAFRPLAGEGNATHFQDGRKVAESSLDRSRPYCRVVLTTPTLPGSNSTFKLAIFGANEVAGDAPRVAIDLKKAFVSEFSCTRGDDATRLGQRTTVKDALDAIGGNLFLYHFGAAQVGNATCRPDGGR